MGLYTLEQDIRLFYIRATSFPGGINDAFDMLKRKLPATEDRTFYGISNPESGVIVYKAAVRDQSEGEGEKYGCETMVLRKGYYRTETILKWQAKTDSIADVFQRLITDPQLDMSSPCIEWYKSNEELICMVRIDQ